MDLESLRRDLQAQGLLPKPAYQPAEFDRAIVLMSDRLARFPISPQFVKSLADGTSESAEILTLIVAYVGGEIKSRHSG